MIPIFVNPFSGSGANRQRVEQLAQTLKEVHGLESRIVDDLALRKQILADPSLADTSPCIVVAGGDGSIASAINDLHDKCIGRIPVAIMSLGNENLLARELGLLGATPQRIAAAIAGRKTRRIDLGVVNGRRFVLMVSVGLDSDVVCRVEAWRKLPAGLRRATRLSYARPILSALAGYHYRPLTLIADGHEIKGTHALVFNINRYAGGLGFAPGAKSDDGLLEYIVLKNPGKLSAIRYLMMVALGRHARCKDICVGSAKAITIRSDEPLYAQADGDTIGQTPLEISVQPAVVDLIVP